MEVDWDSEWNLSDSKLLTLHQCSSNFSRLLTSSTVLPRCMHNLTICGSRGRVLVRFPCKKGRLRLSRLQHPLPLRSPRCSPETNGLVLSNAEGAGLVLPNAAQCRTPPGARSALGDTSRPAQHHRHPEVFPTLSSFPLSLHRGVSPSLWSAASRHPLLPPSLYPPQSVSSDTSPAHQFCLSVRFLEDPDLPLFTYYPYH